MVFAYMKFIILVQMLFDLLSRRKLPARYFAEKYSISQRTVYRYIDCMAISIPVYVKRGRDGGICLSDSYKLPSGFMTKEEYDAAIEALTIAYGKTSEPRFLEVKRKLTAEEKTLSPTPPVTGDTDAIVIDGGAFGDHRAVCEKLRLFEEAIKARAIIELDYQAFLGEHTLHKIEPYALLLRQRLWFVFAFCRTTRQFRLFRLGRVTSAIKTQERFQKRPVSREELTLYVRDQAREFVTVRLRIQEQALVNAMDRLGVENVQKLKDAWYAELSLENDRFLVENILALGTGVEVLSPHSLRTCMAQTAEKLKNMYM